MAAITTVGLDIAKSVFQVHGVDACGSVVNLSWVVRYVTHVQFEDSHGVSVARWPDARACAR